MQKKKEQVKLNRCGIDIVEIDRITAIREKHDFEHRIFSERELAVAAEHGCKPEFFAGRWAAKEAVAKTLGCGFGKDCSPCEVEVLQDESGAPQLALSGAAARRADRLGIRSWCVSVSHEKHYAVAMAVAEC